MGSKQFSFETLIVGVGNYGKDPDLSWNFAGDFVLTDPIYHILDSKTSNV